MLIPFRNKQIFFHAFIFLSYNRNLCLTGRNDHTKGMHAGPQQITARSIREIIHHEHHIA